MDHTYTGKGVVKKKRVTRVYCVSQCSNKGNSGLSFHHFPKNLKLRKQWEIELKMGKPSSASMRVCEAHFQPLDYYPRGMTSIPFLFNSLQIKIKLCLF